MTAEESLNLSQNSLRIIRYSSSSFLSLTKVSSSVRIFDISFFSLDDISLFFIKTSAKDKKCSNALL
ncbi:MAG: hypothetical protein Q9M39_01560 [Sulfurovum sp.]|nr:hypothetical protein [Sulfurovum sp.]